MATFTNVTDSIKDVIKLLVDKTQSEADDVVTEVDTINQGYNGVYTGQISSALTTIVNDYGTILNNRYKNTLRLLLFDLASASDVDLGSSVRSFNQMVENLNRWMYDNSKAFLSPTKTITQGAVTGSGNGQRQYCTEDKFGAELMHTYPGNVEFRCIKDRTQGTGSGKEKFLLIPENEGTNIINKYDKSTYGINTPVSSVNPVTQNWVSGGFFNNANIDTATGTVTDLSPFTFVNGATTDCVASSTSWRDDDAPQSILFANTTGSPLGADDTITIKTEITNTLRRDVAYLGYLVYQNETNGADADVKIKIGTVEKTVVVPDASGVAGSPTVLQWATDSDCWLENFKPVATAGTDHEIYAQIEVVNKSGMANGAGIRIFGIFWRPAYLVGRQPMLISGGSVDWAFNDKWNWSVSYSDTGKIINSYRAQLGLQLHNQPSGTSGYTIITDPT